MNVTALQIPGLLLLEPKVFEDQRGFFMETFRKSRFEALGITDNFVQDNHSGSVRGTLRGLHYQVRQTQGKLVRAVVGEIFDVAVDIRPNSANFGQWAGTVLSAKNRRMLWVPPGFAHGFFVLSEWAEIIYHTTQYYAPEWERTLLWNDPAVGVDWQITPEVRPILSPKDLLGKCLAELDLPEV